jgi:UDP-N-acetylglucosamine--N-acetylmuramyl-(pentapeptide) pyrophosphoryl-undecaprenol N-acetylglucosamine transferase
MSDAPLVVFSGGGTGGHLYPALAIADALRGVRPDLRVVFVGAERGIEARVLPERGEEHLLLPVQGIDRSHLLGSWRALTGLAIGLVRVVRFFVASRPQVVVVTGGYAGAAAGIAAGLLGIPLVLQEQNSLPGAVTMLLTRFAARVHLAFPEAVSRLPVARDLCVVSGNPVRAVSDRSVEEARGSFGIANDALLALVTGGSQGGLGLNRGVTELVEGVFEGDIDRPARLHLLWATGPTHFDGIEATLRGFGELDWVHALPYIENMPEALRAADVAVGRAGAMTTAEFLTNGIPAVLVPLPTSAENHQMINARALEAAGVARVVPEDELNGARLAEELTVISRDDRLGVMGDRAIERARPRATADIAVDIATFLAPVRRAA